MVFRIIFYFFSDYFNKEDVVIVQRTLLPRYFPYFISKLFKFLYRECELIWDFDDNIIENGEIPLNEKNLLEAKAKRIIVTSKYLKNTISEQFHNKVILAPTTDIFLSASFCSDMYETRKKLYNSEINIIWLGTNGNLRFLETIINYLDQAASELKLNYNKILNLYVICNSSFEYKCNSLKIQNITWNRNITIKYMSIAHIGIMPLIDDYFTRGKAGFKLVQYMSLGLPLIGSNVGFNNTIIDNSNGFLIEENNISCWKDCILKLATNYENWEKLSKGSREKFLQAFNPEENIKILTDCISL